MSTATPAGYVYRGAKYTPDHILSAYDRIHTNAAKYRTVNGSIDATIRNMAAHRLIDYDTPSSYSSDEFPKPIAAEDLTAADYAWMGWQAQFIDQENSNRVVIATGPLTGQEIDYYTEA